MPNAERKWQQRYQSSSFLSLHLGGKSGVLPKGTECHHLARVGKNGGCGGTILCQFPLLDRIALAIILFTRSRLVGLIGRVFSAVSTNKEGGGSWAHH